jgi:hypothetical protein
LDGRRSTRVTCISLGRDLYLEIMHYKGKILLGFLPLWVSQVKLVSLVLCSS